MVIAKLCNGSLTNSNQFIKILKRMCKKLLTIFAFVSLLFSQSIYAQEKTVTGTVTDAEDGMPLPQVNVLVKGTTTGTFTDFDGKFSLKVPGNSAVLVLSALGYATKEITVGTSSQLNVTLSPSSEQLDEVVVTALGLQKQARSVGYATTKVDTKEIERINVINPVAALQGKVAGVSINLGGASGVTSSSSITIRGAKSLDKNNSPIFVIDGMIIQEPMTGALSGTDWGSQLKNLNPSDYESVTVLKGAAATALYGSRGANGAIVIVSKGGKFGKQGLGIEVSQTLETAQIYKAPIKMQNIYGAGSPNNGYEGDFLPDGSLQRTAYSWGPKMDGRVIDQYMPNGEATPFVPHSDNWKALYQSPFNMSTSVAVSGGNEDSSYRLSYSNVDNNGVFKRNSFKRNTVNFRGLAKLNDVFSIEAGINYAFSRAQNGANQGGWNWGGNAGFMSTMYIPRNMDLETYESMYRDPETKAVENVTPWGDLRGFLHRRDLNLNQRSENSLLTNLTLRAQISPKLTASIKGNYNYYGISTMEKLYGSGANYGPTGSGGFSRGGSTSGNYNFLGMLQTNDNLFKIGGEEISVDGILGVELYGNTESHSWYKSTNGGLVTPGVFAFSNSVNTIIPRFDYTPKNNQSLGVFAIVNLSWKDQLFLELTGRNDWLSSLTYPTYAVDGKNNYTVFYPSANLSYVFTESLTMPEWISFGKLRASLARAGMGTSPYATINGFGFFNQSAQFDPDRNSVLIANPNLGTAYNPDLKPEVQQSLELGTDIRMFDERLNLDFTYYKTNTFNQIMTLPSVAESGASRQLINAGNIQNQGVEIMLEGTPVKTKDFRWTLGTNFTLNRGKIKELHKDVKEWQLLGQYDAGPEIWAYEGGKFGVLTTSYACLLYTSDAADE